MRWPDARVSALGPPALVRLLDGTEEAPLTDWRTEYGGVLNVRTGEIELPTPTFTPCPYENCPDCEREAAHGHR
ncbi:hypothetical protein DF268_32475 [Streptomyces sp. V2]|uniref:Uncharacterized protein n=1 Tax=Streptomyces niveiscabiei TaxID=164115 RepID=A0ABW9I3T8_9ACTN|nr:MULTISPECIES: hypothetical protein [Streptomyces]PWG09434.1 hypothetical protein DF268_32475 [Streptomyces sp. V2]